MKLPSYAICLASRASPKCPTAKTDTKLLSATKGRSKETAKLTKYPKPIKMFSIKFIQKTHIPKP